MDEEHHEDDDTSLLRRLLWLQSRLVGVESVAEEQEHFETVDDSFQETHRQLFQETGLVKDVADAVGFTQGGVAPTPLYRAYTSLRQGAVHSVPLSRKQRLRLVHSQLPCETQLVQDTFDERAFCGTYTADGNTFLSACQDNTLRIYDTQASVWELQDEIEVENIGWAIIDTVYSPDGQFILYSSWSDSIGLITVNGHRHENIHIADGQGMSCAFSIRFSSESDCVVAGLNGGSVLVVDVHRDQVLADHQAHHDDCNAVAFMDATTNVFVTGADDGLCKVWDRRLLGSDGACVGVFRGHTNGITFIDTKMDGSYFLSQGKDSCVKLWDIRAPTPEQHAHAPEIRMRDYRYNFFGTAGGTASSGRLRGDASLYTFRDHTVAHTLLRARFSPQHTTGQRYIYSASADGCVYIYDILTCQTAAVHEAHGSLIRDVHWHPYKDIIATSSWDGSVRTSSRMSIPQEMGRDELKEVIKEAESSYDPLD